MLSVALGQTSSKPYGSSRRGLITAEDLKKQRNLLKIRNCVLHWFMLLMSVQVNVKQIFPGLATKWSGLNFGQIHIAKCKTRHSFKQCTRNVCGGKDERCLPGMFRRCK